MACDKAQLSASSMADIYSYVPSGCRSLWALYSLGPCLAGSCPLALAAATGSFLQALHQKMAPALTAHSWIRCLSVPLQTHVRPARPFHMLLTQLVLFCLGRFRGERHTIEDFTVSWSYFYASLPAHAHGQEALYRSGRSGTDGVVHACRSTRSRRLSRARWGPSLTTLQAPRRLIRCSPARPAVQGNRVFWRRPARTRRSAQFISCPSSTNLLPFGFIRTASRTWHQGHLN